jgi:anti-anti-sigma regulatory factor
MYTGSLSGQMVCPSCGFEKTASASDLFWTIANEGGHLFCRFTGSKYRLKALESLKRDLEKALQPLPLSFALKVGQGSFFDSSLINVLIRSIREMTEASRPIFVISSDPEVLETFQIMDLDKLVFLVSDEESYAEKLGSL